LSPHFKLSFLTGGGAAVNAPMSIYKILQIMAVSSRYRYTNYALAAVSRTLISGVDRFV
jgi:hypothetical protein